MATKAEVAEAKKESQQVLDILRALGVPRESIDIPQDTLLQTPETVGIPNLDNLFGGAFAGPAADERTKGQRVADKVRSFVTAIDPELSARKDRQDRAKQVEDRARFQSTLQIFQATLNRSRFMQERENDRVRVLNKNIEKRNEFLEELRDKQEPLSDKDLIRIFGAGTIGPVIRDSLRDKTKVITEKKEKTAERSRKFVGKILDGTYVFDAPTEQQIAMGFLQGGKRPPNVPVDPNTPEGRQKFVDYINGDFFKARAEAEGADLNIVVPMLRQTFPEIASDAQLLNDIPTYVDPREAQPPPPPAPPKPLKRAPGASADPTVGAVGAPSKGAGPNAPHPGNFVEAAPAQETSGLLQEGNIDLFNRPSIRNPDGSKSSVRSISFNDQGQEILIPTITPDGKRLQNDEAIQLYFDTGQHLGKFDTPENATTFAKKLSSDFGAGKFDKFDFKDSQGHPAMHADETGEQFRNRLLADTNTDLDTRFAILYLTAGLSVDELEAEVLSPKGSETLRKSGADPDRVLGIIREKSGNIDDTPTGTE